MQSKKYLHYPTQMVEMASPDNGSIETTQVSEPAPYILLFLGLGAIFFARIRNKKFTPYNEGTSL